MAKGEAMTVLFTHCYFGRFLIHYECHFDHNNWCFYFISQSQIDLNLNNAIDVTKLEKRG